MARSIAAIRADAEKHARQLDAVLWLTVRDLGARWGVSATVVREIPKGALPYLALGGSRVRRYHPDDVAAYEDSQRSAPAAAAGDTAPGAPAA